MLSFRSLALVAVAAAVPALATAGEAGTLYTQIGSNGFGLGYAASVSPDWAVRGQFNMLPKQSFSGDVGDFGAGNTMTIDIDWNSVQLLGDWYPSTGGFRMTGGVVFNNNKITLSGIGNVNGKSATVNGQVKMSDSLAPYLGLGYSTRPAVAKGFGFNFDLGVMFQNPKSTLTATGAGVTQADIDAQNVKVQEAIDKLKVMPVLALGVSYAF